VAAPLVTTKFHVPVSRRSVVARTRLNDRLTRVLESRLTLVSAPAGFGKSTLVAEWVAHGRSGGFVCAWLALDDRDNDSRRFWQYVIAALQTAVPGVGTDALTELESGQPTETVVAALLNDLDAVSQELLLVLDDYHVIELLDVHEGMTFLLDHLPARVHIVITSRADPALPLPRLRARGDLFEVRAADLRFTTDEAAAYFNDVMQLGLTARDVASLEGRTEGWIAALQLAGLSMQGRDDVGGFISEFAGDDRYIVDYLLGEVLHNLPADTRRFLLQTSILGRLTASLCDAVTARPDSQATLESLERANLFLVPLDERRQWYRYHHLFADVLRARLLEELPGELQELHRRAGEWLEQQGERVDAIAHLLEAGAFARASELIELATVAMGQAREEVLLRSWYEALPADAFVDRPVLHVGFVGAQMQTGSMEGVEAHLDAAEAALASANPVFFDEASFAALPATIAMYRAALARLHGDVAATAVHARRALELAGEDQLLQQGAAASLIGLAAWAGGDLDEAYRWFAEGMATLGRGGFHADVVGGMVTLADLRIAQGRLGAALALYEEGLRLATADAPPVLRGASDMHIGIAEILRERNDLAGAAEHLDAALDLGDANGLPKNPYRRRVAAARLAWARGELTAATDLLGEAARVYNTDFSPEVEPPLAVRARVHIVMGQLDDARRWASERGLSAADEPSYVREYEHLTLVRLLLAAGELDDAEAMLEQALPAAVQGGRAGSEIEILMLQARLQHARGERATLDDALDRAEVEAYVRLFLDEGAALHPILRESERGRLILASDRPAAARPTAQPGLVEPLSDRELDVLRLLRSELSGPDIARELVVSLNTVRTHTKNIYTKLGVNNRRAAVNRADELGL
jgi:LuxR family maltose regulon positive regulatory protein